MAGIDSGTGPLSANYLHAAVVLFRQISAQNRGKLAKFVHQQRAKPSLYLGRQPLNPKAGASSWEKWHEEGIDRYLERIFQMADDTIRPQVDSSGDDSDSDVSTTLHIGAPNSAQGSTSAAPSWSPSDVNRGLPEHRGDFDSDVATMSYVDSIFSDEGPAMSVVTSRYSWDGSLRFSEVDADVCGPGQEDLANSPRPWIPVAELHEFVTSEALLREIRSPLTTPPDGFVSATWQWELPEFVHSEQFTGSESGGNSRGLGLDSEVILITNNNNNNNNSLPSRSSESRADGSRPQTRRRFCALTWAELVEHQMSQSPEVPGFLAGITQRVVPHIDDIQSNGVCHIHRFSEPDRPAALVRLDWLSIHVDFGSGVRDPLLGELLWAVEVLCRAFRKTQPTREHTSLSTARWKVERCPNEASINRAQTGQFCESINRPSLPRVEITMSLSDGPLEATQHRCWQKLFVGGGSLVDLDDRLTGNLGVDRDAGEGLETSFQMMVTLAAVEYPVMVGGGVVFVGYETVLVPVRAESDWAQFHLITNNGARGQINPYIMDLGSQLKTEDFRQFQDKRCFLGWCEFAQINLGTKALPANVGYSGGRDKGKSTRFDGFTISSQVGVSEPLTALLGFEANYRRSSNRLQFTPFGGYSKLLRDTASELAIVYDAVAKRCWLVPKLSLLLHMSHAYVLSCPDAPENTVPYTDGHADAADLIGSLEPHGDVLVLGESKNDGLVFRQLLFGLNTNLLTTVASTQRSAGGRLYGFEFMDVVTSPGRGSCMKALGLESPGKKWLAVVNVVDSVVVCAGIGNVITAVMGSDPCNGAAVALTSGCRESTPCSVLPSGFDYMAATIPCLARLARRRGDEPAATDFIFKISDNSFWHIMGDPFRQCRHDGGSSPDTDSGSDSCWKRTDLMQQLVSRRATPQVRIGPINIGPQRLPVTRPALTASIPSTGAVVFGQLAG